MVCDQCKGSGRVVCSNCEGKGYFMDMMDYKYYPCLNCGGEGIAAYSSIPAILKAESKGEIKFGSGWVKCKKCNGTGLLGNDYEFLLNIIKKLLSNEKISDLEMGILKEKYNLKI